MNKHKYLRQPFGKSHYNSRLSEAEVLEVLELSQFIVAREIAEAYSVSLSTVYFIKIGVRWAKLTKAASKIRAYKKSAGKKLSPRKAKNIRKKYKLGHSQNSLAKKYGVSQPVIFDIVHGRTHQ